MAIYAFHFDGDTLLLRADSERLAVCRAFHEVVDSYELGADRLVTMEWPSESDYSRLGSLEDPVILEGG